MSISKVKLLIHNAVKWDGFWWIAGIAVVLIIGGFFSWVFWKDLRGENESLSTTIRNLGLIVGGVIAIILAVWRSTVAERQAGTAQAQADIAQQSLLNERYQRGAEMLGSPVLSVRLGGIFALRRLAEEYPEQYHIQILDLLCAFVRNPTKDETIYMQDKLREDVQAVLTYVGRRDSSGLKIEREVKFKLNLRGANLSYAQVSGLNFAGADLSNAKLDHASFFDMPFKQPDLSDPIPSGPNQPQARISLNTDPVSPDLAGLEGRLADLSLATLRCADLSDSRLRGTDLSGARLVDANLSNCEISYSNLRMADLLGASVAGASILDSDLTGVKFANANLTDTRFPSTKLYGANFYMASLDGADFSGAVLSWENGKYVVTGLTQKQLDKAKVNPSNPPDLTGVVEVGSGKPLKWSEKSLNDRG